MNSYVTFNIPASKPTKSTIAYNLVGIFFLFKNPGGADGFCTKVRVVSWDHQTAQGKTNTGIGLNILFKVNHLQSD